ncbi:MAG: PilZ domain-containing protein [Deltaproteobacteria bacterium]
MEQRRSQRYPQSLPVQLTVGRTKVDANTLDVSRHGLFVKTDAAVEERQLLQLSIDIPSGPLPATAVVSHRKLGQTPGLGLQLFALSSASKARWDEFVYGLDAAGVAPAPSRTAPDTPTFLIKLKNVNRLLEFYDRNVRAGALYLTTPVLREQGTKVALNMIHPDSEEEFVLTGSIASVCMDTPKGMEIHLDRMSDSALAGFREYVTTGVPPEVPERVPSAEAVPASIPTEEALSEDLSIDIVVDEGALEDSTQFVWRDVSEDDLVIDFDTTGMGEVRKGTTDLAPITEDNLSRDITSPYPQTPITASLGPERELLVAVRCDKCEADYGSLRLGPAKGDLGVIASHQPYWWPSEQKIVSILRLNPPDERRELRAQLGEVELNRPISLRLAFKIADMSGPPRCPDGTAARVTPLIRALKEAITALGDDPRIDLDVVRCSACQERGVVVERWD